MGSSNPRVILSVMFEVDTLSEEEGELVLQVDLLEYA